MHFPALRVPTRLLEHPVEAVIACCLLLAMLFVSADPASRAEQVPTHAAGQAP
jgi:hypothetical protein